VVQQPARGIAGERACAAGNVVLDGRVLIPAGEIPLRGRHKWENVQAAAMRRRGPE